MHHFTNRGVGMSLAAVLWSGVAAAETVSATYDDVFSNRFSSIDASITAPVCVEPNMDFELKVAGLGAGDVATTAYMVLENADWEYHYTSAENEALDRFPRVKINAGTDIDNSGFNFGSTHSDTYVENISEPTTYTYIFGQRSFGHDGYDVAVDIQVEPGGEAQTIPLDIKPQSCPNPLNVTKNGVLPLAIVGTGLLDVRRVDISSVTLSVNGLPLDALQPLRSAFEDVATPHQLTTYDALDCTIAGPDGFEDLSLKYRAQDLVAALEASLERSLVDDEVLIISVDAALTGTPSGGSACESGLHGEDVIRVISNGKK